MVWTRTKGRTTKQRKNMATSIPKQNCRTSPLLFIMPCRCGNSNPSSLVEVIQTTIQTIPETCLRRVTLFVNSLSFPPKVLLALLTYCYAKGIYRASEIQALMIQDAAFKQICTGQLPSVRSIRAFQLLNRAHLESCLAAALHFLERQKAVANMTTPVEETMAIDEAKRRIIMADCLDGLELDVACFS